MRYSFVVENQTANFTDVAKHQLVIGNQILGLSRVVLVVHCDVEDAAAVLISKHVPKKMLRVNWAQNCTQTLANTAFAASALHKSCLGCADLV
jgi:hypothetical protein